MYGDVYEALKGISCYLIWCWKDGLSGLISRLKVLNKCNIVVMICSGDFFINIDYGFNGFHKTIWFD